MKVFKFRGGNDQIVCRDLKTLARNQIYAAAFETLNDPFEGRVILGEEGFRVEVDVRALLPSTSLSLLGAAEKQFLTMAADFVEKSKGCGVYSLSKNVLNPVLWTHYADSHRGFCIEFDLDKLMEHSMQREVTIEVDYSDCVPTLTGLDIVALEKDTTRVAQLLAGTKTMHWAHQEEVRILTAKPGLHAYDFRAVSGIYFGKDSTADFRAKVMRLMRGRGVAYFRIKVPAEGFQLAAYPIEDPFLGSKRYRERVASVADGVPEWDAELEKYRDEALAAVEIVRRDPYCELVFHVDLSTSKGSAEDPVIYVHYTHSRGTDDTKYFSISELRLHIG